jgi:hypothetical protein
VACDFHNECALSIAALLAAEIEMVMRRIVALPSAALGAIAEPLPNCGRGASGTAVEDAQETEDGDASSSDGPDRAGDISDIGTVGDEPGRKPTCAANDRAQGRMALVKFEKQLHALKRLSIRGKSIHHCRIMESVK